MGFLSGFKWGSIRRAAHAIGCGPSSPFAYLTLRAIAPWGGIGFLLLAAAMSLTAFGGLQHRRWGWTLAVAIFVVNALADAVRLIAGDVLEGLIGTLAAGAIVYALLRPNVSGVFAKRT